MTTILKRKQAKTDKQFMNTTEAGRFLGCSYRVMRQILQSGELPFRRVGGKVIISRDALRRWAEFKPVDSAE